MARIGTVKYQNSISIFSTDVNGTQLKYEMESVEQVTERLGLKHLRCYLLAKERRNDMSSDSSDEDIPFFDIPADSIVPDPTETNFDIPSSSNVRDRTETTSVPVTTPEIDDLKIDDLV